MAKGSLLGRTVPKPNLLQAGLPPSPLTGVCAHAKQSENPVPSMRVVCGLHARRHPAGRCPGYLQPRAMLLSSMTAQGR
jgi:hypothetical protein